MPRRDGPWRRMEHLSFEERLANDGIFQAHWYTLVAERLAHGKGILDVGAGSGYGMGILRVHGAKEVHGVDPFPLRVDVSSIPLAKLGTGAWDGVIACDVIEHVEQDLAFLLELERLAREWVFISTPNWNVSRCGNEFHVREYTPEELDALLAGRDCLFFSSDDNHKVQQIGTLREATTCFGVLIHKRSA